MSDVERPEGWTEEQWRDHFESAYDTVDDTVSVAGANQVDVPDIEAGDAPS